MTDFQKYVLNIWEEILLVFGAGIWVGLLIGLTATPAKSEPQFYASFSVGSVHINATREFNEFNPGIGLGVTWGSDTFRYGLEAGTFVNSYDFQATYAKAQLRWRVADLDHVNLWAGGFVGFAEYPNLISYANKIGIPNFDDYIMIGGLSFTAEFERFNMAVLYMPFGEAMDGVAVLKFSIPIGR